MKNMQVSQTTSGFAMPAFIKMASLILLFLVAGNSSHAQYSIYATDNSTSARYHRDTTFVDFFTDSSYYSTSSGYGYFSHAAVYTWTFSDSTTQVGMNVTHAFTRNRMLVPDFSYTLTIVDTTMGISGSYENYFYHYPDVMNCSYFGDSLTNYITPWSGCNTIQLQASPIYSLYHSYLRRIYTMSWGDGTTSVDSVGYDGIFDQIYTYTYGGVYKMRSSLLLTSPDGSVSCPVLYSPLKANFFDGPSAPSVIIGSVTVCEGDTIRLTAHDTTALFHNLMYMTDLTGTDGRIDSPGVFASSRRFFWSHYRESDGFYYEGNRSDSILVYPHVRADDTAFVFSMYSDCSAMDVYPMQIRVNVLRSTLPPVIGPKYLCSGSTYTYTNATSGGTWTTDNPTVASVNAATGAVTAISTGNALLRYFSGTGCPALKYITVNPASTPGIIGPASIVPGTVAAFTDSGAGSVWSTSNASVASVSATGNVYALVPGDATITSTLNIGCDTFTYSLGVYVTNSIISTIAGTGYSRWVSGVNGSGRYSGDGVAATSADLNFPNRLAVDDSLNLYINDWYNNRIRKVNSSGVISTIAGNGVLGYTGDGGAATNARISSNSIACDRYGNIYFCDGINNVVRRIDAVTGNVTTIAGTGSTTGGYSGDGGPATAAQLRVPAGIATDVSGNIYIADGHNRVVRKVDPSGTITTIAGTGSAGFTGDGGPATNARLSQPLDLVLDTIGNIFVVDLPRVRKIDPSGIISTVFNRDSMWWSERYGEGRAANHYGTTAYCVTFDGDGRLLVGDGYQVYRISNSGILNRFAGGGSAGYSGDGGFAINASTGYSQGITRDRLGNIYITDATNNVIRKVGARTLYLPAPTVTDTNIREIRIVSFTDTVTTPPCTYPANVNYTVRGAVLGHPSIYDSVYIRINAGDGSSVFHVVTIDTTTTYTIAGNTYFGYSYSGTHTYSSAGTYMLTVEGITNSGVYSTEMNPAFHPVFPVLNLDACGSSGSGNITTMLTTSDTLSVCRTPYTPHVNLAIALHGAAALVSSFNYLVNFGDGSADTVHLTPATDGHGHHTANAILSHSYTFPGTFITSYRNLDSTTTYRGAAFAIGSSCSIFSGYLYRDENSNCNMDTVDARLRYWPVAIVNNTSHDTTYVWCDRNGRYSANLTDSNSYTILPDYFRAFGYGGDSLTLSCPSSVYTITPLPGHTYSQNFGFTCHGTIDTLDMNVVGIGNRFVPGRTTTVAAWASNSWGYMCDSLSATVSLTIDTNLTYISMASGPTPSISGQTLTWTFGTTRSLLDFYPIVNVMTHTTATIGDSVRNFVRVMPVGVMDPDTADNRYAWVTPVRTSWDPNEKEVSPAGFGVDGYIPNETPLTYTIHFQNTGSDTAYDITVVDTISHNLDLATLQLVNASHDVMVIQEGTSNVVKFRFNNVLLPDSTTNLSASNGYVTFNILPKSGLAPETHIRNAAAIYFDYNPAVLTNATINTIEDTLRAIAGSSTVCVGSSVTLTNALSGGVWSSSNGHATVTGGIVTGISAGTDTISYSVYGGEQVVTKVITINPLPSAGTITGATTVCEAATTALTATTGGAWSTSSSSTASISSTGVVSGIAAGSVTVSYTVTNSCGTDVAISTITVNPLPNAGTITGTTTVCEAATTALTATTGGAWSVSSSSTASISSSGVVSGIAAGTAIVSYTVTNSCGTDVTTTSITVNPLPVAATVTGGATTLCAGATTTFSASASGGAWSSSDPSRATVSGGVVTALAAGIDTIRYTITNSCGSAATPSVITITTGAVAGTISGPTSVCVGSAITLTPSVTGGIWSSGSIATIAGGTLTGVAPGIDTVYYIVSNSCGTAVATYVVTINPLPSSGTISGAGSVCMGSTSTYTDAVSGGSWSSSNTSVATINTTGTINAVALGTTVVSYTVSNGCGTTSATRSVLVLTTPVADTITGATTVCAGSIAMLSIMSTGGSWSSSNAAIASVDATGNVAGITAGSATISYIITNICGMDVATRSMTVNPIPVAGTITGPDSICNDVDLTLAGATAGGTWQSSNTSVATVSATGRVHRIASGTAVISYTVTNPCGTAGVTHPMYMKSTSACNTGVAIEAGAVTAIEVYPNPSHGEFTISIPGNATNVAIVVTDVAGKVITEIQPKNASDLKVPVNLGNVASGTYLLRVNVDGKMYHDKLIVWY